MLEKKEKVLQKKASAEVGKAKEFTRSKNKRVHFISPLEDCASNALETLAWTEGFTLAYRRLGRWQRSSKHISSWPGSTTRMCLPRTRLSSIHRFIRVQEAYETLSDPGRRALYDSDMDRGLHLAFSARRRYHSDEMLVVAEILPLEKENVINQVSEKGASLPSSQDMKNKEVTHVTRNQFLSLNL